MLYLDFTLLLATIKIDLPHHRIALRGFESHLKLPLLDDFKDDLAAASQEHVEA